MYHRPESPRSVRVFIAFAFRLIGLVSLLVGSAPICALAEPTPVATVARFPHLSPDQDFSRAQTIDKAAYITLINDLRAYIGRAREEKAVDRVSVFFRDLRAGPTFGIDEDALFVPASLLKLPAIIALFDLADEQPGLLEKKILYSPAGVTHFKMPRAIEVSPSGMVEGQSYSIETLMRSTLVYSDNLSYFLLIEQLNYVLPGGSDRFGRTYRELGVVDPRHPDDQVVTVHGQASLMRLLFFASYLDAPASEKILSWLVDSTYSKGLVAGVPAGVKVANKFGERPLSTGGIQLHDCGIIYYPGAPYLACVMTMGRNWADLSKTIATISRMIYAEIDRRHR